MKRLLVLLAAMVLSIVGATAPASAANPHVVKGPTVTLSGNTLTIAVGVAGLGNIDEATFTLSGTVDVFSRCYNKGGNKPQADNKQETVEVNATDTFPVRNGRTNATFEVSPVSTLACPGNQRVVIESYSYDLTLTGPGLDESFSG